MLVHANPSLDTQRTRRGSAWWWLLIALEVLICLVIIWDTGAYSPDDAYIYFNGARQLARGELPNMTPGETPTNAWAGQPWLWLIAPAFLLGLSPLIWTKILGLLLLLGTVDQLRRLVLIQRPRTSPVLSWGLAGLALAYAPLVYWSVSGLETPLYIFSLVATLRLLMRDLKQGRPSIPLGLALGLHLVSRPEGFINAGLILLAIISFSIGRNRGFRLRDARRPLIGLLPGLMAFLLPLIWYPTLLHAGVAAKTTGGFPGLWQLGGLALDFALTPGNLFLYLGAFLFIFGRKGVKPRLDWRLRLLVGLLLVIHPGKSLLTLDWMGVQRLWLASATTALAATLIILPDLLEGARGRLLSTGLLAVALGAGLLGWRGRIRYHFHRPGDPTEVLARYIARLRRPASWMLATDMGVLPYYAGMPTIDAENRPICNHHLARYPGDLDYVSAHRLDFIVVTTPYISPPRPGDSTYTLLNRVMVEPGFVDEYSYALCAEWRAPADYGSRSPTKGRYFHLFVSNELVEDPPEPPRLLLKTPPNLPPVYPEAGDAFPAVPRVASDR
jgi:hypothetical protein